MECPVCISVFTTTENAPLVFPCGHTLCKQCVAALKPHGSELNCPQCRSAVPFSSLASIPVNYSILEQLSVASSPAISSQDDEVCDLHQSKRAKFFCQTCSKTFCSKCVVLHSGPGHQIQSTVSQVDLQFQHLATKLSQNRIAVKEHRQTAAAHSDYLKRQRAIVDAAYDQLQAGLQKEREDRNREINEQMARIANVETALEEAEKRLVAASEVVTQAQHSHISLKAKKAEIQRVEGDTGLSVPPFALSRLALGITQAPEGGFVQLTRIPTRSAIQAMDIAVFEPSRNDVATPVAWQYKTSRGLWVPYQTEMNTAVETAFRSDKKAVVVGRYKVDLVKFLQVNVHSGYFREVRRVTL